MTTYMTSSPISPLQQRFVELPQPLATDVDANILLNSEAAVTIDFGNVPIDKMEEIDGMFKTFMHEIMNKGSEFWDMERMHNISMSAMNIFINKLGHLIVYELFSYVTKRVSLIANIELR